MPKNPGRAENGASGEAPVTHLSGELPIRGYSSGGLPAAHCPGASPQYSSAEGGAVPGWRFVLVLVVRERFRVPGAVNAAFSPVSVTVGITSETTEDVEWLAPW